MSAEKSEATGRSSRATGRTGSFFNFPKFCRIPLIGARSIGTEELAQQRAAFEYNVTVSDRRRL
jgi:hypothetical protein